jgi:hypothetical protein
MNKIAVIVPFYQRESITELCFKRLKSQSKKLKFDVIVAGSEGEKSKEEAKGLKYIETPNKPLGKKLNLLLKECKDYDGVLVLGSDDFISDSVIKMYQKIDCTKAVYYSFNDIYIYSNKYRQIKSDFDYTRAGNGIGVARLYTKPTLKAMNYEIWSNTRLKGLDGNADKRLRSKKVKEIQLDLDKHLVLDVKIEQNISAHEIIFTGHKEHDLDLFKKLGRIGSSILKLEATREEKIVLDKVYIPKIQARVVKAFNQHKEGDVIALKTHNYKSLLKAGYISPLNG